ncbi:WD40-repeat-containing domain protein [Mucor mucedo]|uniref:WD40-repeat-containing domain protein n=1 Tax=Mucor mucedo TaxID=29922 RepID=UPI0022206CC5|nr:WD40-repeat-containing domain protein [Mucor mucedo]KAI7886878.1 WD40-repeat-containing domain protein [Mucor mucedo]
MATSKQAEALAPPPPVYIFREHQTTVSYVQLFDNDNFLVSSDGEGWIIIWKMKTRRPIMKWKAHKDNCIKAISINENTLISQGRDNMIHIWKLPILQEIHALTNDHPELKNSIVYDGLGFCKLSCYNNQESFFLCFPSMDNMGSFDIYDLTYQRYVLRNIGQTDSGTHRLGSCMAVQLFRTSENLFVLAGYESGKVALWEIKDIGEIIWTQQAHTEPVLDLSIDHMKSFLMSSSADNNICKYSLATGDIIKKITIKKSGIVALKIRPDNKIFASGGYDGRIRIFSVKSMKPLAILAYHRDTIYSLDFSFNDNWLIGASQDNRISLWNIY